METLCTIPVVLNRNKKSPNGKYYLEEWYNETIAVKLWHRGDPFPALGSSVGVDTETELITETMHDPPMVVLGVFDGENKVCYIVYWDEAVDFIRQLNAAKTTQYFFNLGFDEQVIDNLDDQYTLMQAIDSDKVVDIQIRAKLHEIATVGFTRGGTLSLKGCAKFYMGLLLDKGDPNDKEHSARLTFKRFNDDGTPYRITDEQARYLPWDCIATWGLGQVLRPRAGEDVHTRGAIALAHISANGIPVDMEVFNAFERLLKHNFEDAKKNLLVFGYPDPDKSKLSPSQEATGQLQAVLDAYFRIYQVDVQVSAELKASQLRMLLLLFYMNAGNDIISSVSFITSVYNICQQQAPFTKPMQTLYNEMVDKYNLMAFDASKRASSLRALVWQVFKNLMHCITSEEEFSLDDAMARACDFMDEHPYMFQSGASKVKPTAFMLNHINQVLRENPALELPTTKGGKPKISKAEQWRLVELGIKDPLMEAYIDYQHCNKLLSTYVKRDYVKADGRMHPKLTNVVRTGRTSCSSPNLRNSLIINTLEILKPVELLGLPQGQSASKPA